jgi:hypothetical protein
LDKKIFEEEVRLFAIECRRRRIFAFVRKIFPGVEDVVLYENYVTNRVKFSETEVDLQTMYTGEKSVTFLGGNVKIEFHQMLPKNNVKTIITLFSDNEDVYTKFVQCHWKCREYALKWFDWDTPLKMFRHKLIQESDAVVYYRQWFYETIGRMHSKLPKDVRKIIWNHLI